MSTPDRPRRNFYGRFKGKALKKSQKTYLDEDLAALSPGPVASWSATLPDDPGILGLTLYTQAAHLLGVAPFELSNAQDLCMTY